ncbi:uncharacterized protein LOC6645057 [Drosophila willistoni]|uniref:uncharacterized protein LOC6645057 n=1 Tax=Drosophila willistoni TaxID=7260 RepID=UPI00017D8031|nr:uncharacterized protein LOC6645057 [Drosophila willistoni]
MGILSTIHSLKNWTMEHVWHALVQPKKPIEEKPPVIAFPNLGEDIRQVVQTKEFESALNSASPFLLASLGAWPGYWVYRGMDYHSHRMHVPLQIYIRQTFLQAKLLQFAIILAGIFTVVKEQRRSRMMPIDEP